jgi:hypothetical protein
MMANYWYNSNNPDRGAPFVDVKVFKDWSVRMELGINGYVTERYVRDLPEGWVYSAILKLSIMEPDHVPIEGLGQRRDVDMYRLVLRTKGEER